MSVFVSRIIIVLCQISLIFFASFAWAGPTSYKNTDKEIDQLIRKMTLKEKVGQLFMFGFVGQDVHQGLEQSIKELKPGGVIIFGRNIKSPEQISILNNAAQKASSLPLLIAVDQEGGIVARISTQPPIPSAMSVGMTEDPELARKLGIQTGIILKKLGFNMNLAPVLDIADPEQESFIGARSFGKIPAKVAKISTAYALGLADSSILPTAKHFPGTGNLNQDPHLQFVKKMIGLEELFQDYLAPFKTFMSIKKPTAIMMAHVAYPNIDKDSLPATFSSHITTSILRNRLHYEGLVLTDDVMMDGARVYKNPAEAALKALHAGADMVMMTWSKQQQKRAIERVVQAVKNNEISEARIDESLQRILEIKETYAKEVVTPLSNKEIRLATSTPKLKEVEEEILEKNLEKSFDPATLVEIRKDFKSIVIMSSSHLFTQSFKSSTAAHARYFNLTNTVTAKSLTQFLIKNSKSLFVIPVNGKKIASVVEAIPQKFRSQIMVVNLVAPGVVEGNSPNPLVRGLASVKDSASFLKVINLYSNHPNAGRRIADWLADKNLNASNK